MSDMVWFIAAAAILTYLTRVGGHLVLSRFERISPRVEAALDAVPVAVLTAIVVPVLLDGDAAERVVIVLCGFLTFRLSLLSTVFLGTGLVILARALGA